MRLTRPCVLLLALLPAAVAVGQIPPTQKPPERLLPSRGQTAPTGPVAPPAPKPRPSFPPLPSGPTGSPAPVAPAHVAPAPPQPSGPTGLPAPTAPPAAASPAAVAPPAAAAPIPPPASPARATGSVSVTLKDGSTKPAEGAIVYIETVDPALWKNMKRPSARAAELTMKGKQFEPRAVAVLAGKSVAFPNQDPVFHNAFSLSAGNKFDLGLYKDGATRTQTFSQPGVVRVFCNIHPAMSAHVLVLQNPWWAQVSADGSYSLADIPPGTWNLKVWHERGGESQRELTVGPDQRARVDFELDARKYKVVPHKNKLGKDYSTDGY